MKFAKDTVSRYVSLADMFASEEEKAVKSNFIFSKFTTRFVVFSSHANISAEHAYREFFLQISYELNL